jgi:hypothetical protein
MGHQGPGRVFGIRVLGERGGLPETLSVYDFKLKKKQTSLFVHQFFVELFF